MSKPRYGWWGYVKGMIRRYPNHVNEDEYRAVRAAIEETERYIDGADRMRVVRMVLMKDTHTLHGAALAIPCSYDTVKKWQQQFIRCVAKSFSCSELLKD